MLHLDPTVRMWRFSDAGGSNENHQDQGLPSVKAVIRSLRSEHLLPGWLEEQRRPAFWEDTQRG